MTKKVLVSGASIAGPTAGIVLGRRGIDVTIVERSPGLRGGGYPIDIRAIALEVADRLDILRELRAGHVDIHRTTLTADGGRSVGPFEPGLLTGSVRAVDIEIARGDVAAALYKASRDIVSYRFNDSIAAIRQDRDGVDVRFDSGVEERYDIVIGADGLHSNTRSLAFAPAPAFERYMGFCFVGFSLPNPEGMMHEVLMHNAPGTMAAMFGTRKDAPLLAIMAFKHPESPFLRARTLDEQRQLVARAFHGQGGFVPRLLEAMTTAPDTYFDTVSQVRMPKWSSGRVVLTGDAAHATSFLSGQGSSVAMVSSYVLASEVAANADHEQAFASYERVARSFVEANQDLVPGGTADIIPETMDVIDRRNAAIATAIEHPGGASGLHGDNARPAFSAIDLPAYLPLITPR